MTTITASSVIDAPVSAVWALIRDFNGLPNWHPRMKESHIEGGGPSDQIGCVRNFTVASGARLREKLVGLSDHDYTVAYSIQQSPDPVTNHLATLRLVPITDGDRCFIQWTAQFDAPADKADAIAAGMGQHVYQAGFDALKRHFQRPA